MNQLKGSLNFSKVPKLKICIKNMKNQDQTCTLRTYQNYFKMLKLGPKVFEKEDPTSLVTTHCKWYHVHVPTMLNIICYSCSSHKTHWFRFVMLDLSSTFAIVIFTTLNISLAWHLTWTYFNYLNFQHVK